MAKGGWGEGARSRSGASRDCKVAAADRFGTFHEHLLEVNVLWGEVRVGGARGLYGGGGDGGGHNVVRFSPRFACPRSPS